MSVTRQGYLGLLYGTATMMLFNHANISHIKFDGHRRARTIRIHFTLLKQAVRYYDQCNLVTSFILREAQEGRPKQPPLPINGNRQI